MDDAQYRYTVTDIDVAFDPHGLRAWLSCTLDDGKMPLLATDRVTLAGESGSFSLVPGDPTEHLHMAFGTHEDAAVAVFHEAATAAGAQSNGAPGERPQYHAGYYGAFVLDRDGNNVEVVNHNR